MTDFVFTLYVTGKTVRSERAILNLTAVCDEILKDQYQLEIIDVLESPQKAEDHKILATPTLIKSIPPPIRRIIGDLSNKEILMAALDINTTQENN